MRLKTDFTLLGLLGILLFAQTAFAVECSDSYGHCAIDGPRVHCECNQARGLNYLSDEPVEQTMQECRLHLDNCAFFRIVDFCEAEKGYCDIFPNGYMCMCVGVEEYIPDGDADWEMSEAMEEAEESADFGLRRSFGTKRIFTGGKRARTMDEISSCEAWLTQFIEEDCPFDPPPKSVFEPETVEACEELVGHLERCTGEDLLSYVFYECAFVHMLNNEAFDEVLDCLRQSDCNDFFQSCDAWLFIWDEARNAAMPPDASYPWQDPPEGGTSGGGTTGGGGAGLPPSWNPTERDDTTEDTTGGANADSGCKSADGTSGLFLGLLMLFAAYIRRVKTTR